jgi:hypothetical protein
MTFVRKRSPEPSRRSSMRTIMSIVPRSCCVPPKISSATLGPLTSTSSVFVPSRSVASATFSAVRLIRCTGLSTPASFSWILGRLCGAAATHSVAGPESSYPATPTVPRKAESTRAAPAPSGMPARRSAFTIGLRRCDRSRANTIGTRIARAK